MRHEHSHTHRPWLRRTVLRTFLLFLLGLATSPLLTTCAEGRNGIEDCVPQCSGYMCGVLDPVCGIPCGGFCDPGCTDHCLNNNQDCDETGFNCGGEDCPACSDCVPSCSGLSCGDLDPVCNTPCGDPCDAGCLDHCANGIQDCDETSLDCGGSACAACNCTPNCTGLSCGQLDPNCGSPCGSICDSGCTSHCSNGTQDCDETGADCGGAVCSSCDCIPDCSGYTCGAIEPTCGTICGTGCDAGCTTHCSNGTQDCDETGVDCGGADCSACSTGGCGDDCYVWDGYCDSSYLGNCDGCDMGCGLLQHDPDCDDPASTCLDACPCLLGDSSYYCDGWDDCTDTNCECAGE